jgi:hypothetical protein
MNRGFADEAVVIVKVDAEEVMVIWLRVKHRQSDQEVGDEGRNMSAVNSLIIDSNPEISPLRDCL